MEKLPMVHMQATERLATLEPAQAKARKYAEDKTLLQLDEPERVQLRVDRLLNNPLVVKGFRDKGVLDELRTRPFNNLTGEAQAELERTIGGADYAPIWFLTRGAQIRQTVGMIRARTSAGKQYAGTGFLMGPRLLLTNHHVLDWTDIDEEGIEQIVDSSFVDFDFEESFDGVTRPAASFRLDPNTLLLLNPWHQLDYIVVAVEPRSVTDASRRLEDFGYNKLTADQGKISKGEPVFVVQHPNNQPKKLVFQNNRMIDRSDAYLAYEADTDTGSSGSPVFNRQWEVLALHHATQIARDEQGRILAKDGSLWDPSLGSRQVQYLDLNEGVRISQVVNSLKARCSALKGNARPELATGERCNAEGIRLLEEALQFSGAAPVAIADPDPVPPPRPGPTRAVGNSRPRPVSRTSGFPPPD